MKSIKLKFLLWRSSAFTLMEIMVVVGIIMLLAGISIPVISKSLGKGQKSAATLQIQGFENAITNFQIDIGHIPKDLNELVKNNGNKKWDGPYLKKKDIPVDPWGNAYLYEVSSSSAVGYKITSYGSDGAPGGEKIAADLTNL